MTEILSLDELHARSKIGVRKLKWLHTNGFLVNVSFADDRLLKMHKYLSSRRPLSVEQLLALIREPKLIDSLPANHARARASVAEIGKPEQGALPAADWLHILGASMNEPSSLAVIVDWLRSVIPAGGCGYHWIAVRAMWNCPAEKFKQTYSRLPRALINARAHPSLAGWSNADTGTTRFMRPILDL